MKNSSWISPSSKTRTLVRSPRLPRWTAWVIALVVLAGACSDPAASEENCWEEDPPATKSYSTTSTHRGRVNVIHEVTYSGESSTTKRSIVAGFSDISSAEMKSRTPASVMCDVSCVLLTGAPYKVCNKPAPDPCELASLDVDQVELEVGSGKVALTKQAGGSFSAQDVADPLFASTSIKAVVTGQDAAGYFPSFDITSRPIDLMELSKPDPESSSPVGSSDLKINWKAGNGDFVLVEVKSTDASVKDKVQCFLQDDGCHNMGACVLDLLDIKAGDAFKLAVERVHTEAKDLDANSSILLNLASHVETTLMR